MGVPKTLPADFQGWDKAPAGPPATLPADFNQWDQPRQAEAAPDQFAKDREVTEVWAQNHKILGPIARFLVAGGQNAASAITDTPSFLYHAITDPATPEEYGLSPEQRVIARLGVEQGVKAGQSYASGEVTPKGALSILPEALGTGVGQVAGGAVYGKGGEIAGEAPGVVKASATFARPAVVSALRTAADIVDPELTGVVSPRLAHAQRLAGRLANVLAKKEMPTAEAPAVLQQAANEVEALAPTKEAATQSDFQPGKFTQEGWYYLGRLQEIARQIEEEQAAAGPKNVTPSRAAALKKPVTPPATSDDLTNLLQESLKRAQAAKGKPLGGSLADLQ